MRLLFPIGLAFAAALAPAASAAPGVPNVVARDGVEVSILPTITPALASATVVDVALDVEARTDDAARRLRFRSLRVEAMVDCRAGANQVVKAEVFDNADLSGRGQLQPISHAWVRPTAESYMSAVVGRVCANGAVATSGATGAAPSLPVVLDAAPTAPSMVAAVSPPSAAAATGPPAPIAPLAAQVAASRTAKDAQKALDALRALIAPPLTASIQQTLVQKAHVFRASVQGFASLAQARAFCVQAAHVGQPCWVRQNAAATAR